MKTLLRYWVVVLGLGILAVAQESAPLVTTAATTHEITLRVEGLGCSTATHTPDTFDILIWSFGASQPLGAFLIGSGASAFKTPNVSDLTLQKAFDACSPKLFEAAVTGKTYTNLTLTEEGQGIDGRIVPVLTIKLTDGIVDSYKLSGSETSQPVENISLTFRKICIQDNANSVQVCYDRKTQKVN